jgi:hypothetical protein
MTASDISRIMERLDDLNIKVAVLSTLVEAKHDQEMRIRKLEKFVYGAMGVNVFLVLAAIVVSTGRILLGG